MSIEVIAAVVAGAITVIGAVVAAVNSVIAQVRTKAIAKVNDAQTDQLITITTLVDGRYSEVLQQLADVKRLLAAETGRQIDVDRAIEAQDMADAQEARVVEAKTIASEATP